METKFLEIADGRRVAYREAGVGSAPVVFLHGYSFSSQLWARVLDRMPSAYTGYAIDLSGFGQTDKPETGYDFGAMAEFVIQFLDALDIERAILIGHSYGGMIAQKIAVTFQDRARAFVFTNCMAMNKPPIGLIPRIEAQIAAYDDADATREIFQQATPRFFDAANVTASELEAFIEVNLQAGTAALKQAVAHVFTHEVIATERLAAVTRPSLIVIGSHDVIDWKAAVALNDAIPESETFVVEGAGHCPMWERPERWSHGVFDFLRRRLAEGRDA